MCASSSAIRAASAPPPASSRSHRNAPPATARPATNPIAIPLPKDTRLLRRSQRVRLHADVPAGAVRIPAEEDVAVALEGANHGEHRGIRGRAGLVETRYIGRVAV